jgi:hypothetical protein
MNAESPDDLIAVPLGANPLRAMLTQAFKFSRELPRDLSARLMQLPGRPPSAQIGDLDEAAE